MIRAMNPAPRPRLPPYADALTGLRGVAALWVLVFHLWQFTGGPKLVLGPLDLTPLAARGHLGVDLFFVLSGYLIGGPWVVARLGGPSVAFMPFWKRRFLRVFPAYWAQWLVLAMIALLGAGAFPMGPLESVLSVTLSFNFIGNEAPLNAVWWSLPVEWDFYLVVPLMAWLFVSRRALPPLLVVLVLAVVGWRVLSWWMVMHYLSEGVWLYRWIIQLPGRLDQFVLGMLVAHALLLGRGNRSLHLFILGALATLVLVWLSARAGNIVDRALEPWIFFQFTLVGAAFAALVAAAATPGSRLVQVLLANRALVYCGTVSYSLYLWHYPVLQWARSWARAHAMPTASWSWVLLAVITSLLAASLSYFLVERPFLPQRRKPRMSPAPASSLHPERNVP